ncbi:unnamed protein product, partial [Amoebophrya sp. A25]
DGLQDSEGPVFTYPPDCLHRVEASSWLADFLMKVDAEVLRVQDLFVNGGARFRHLVRSEGFVFRTGLYGVWNFELLRENIAGVSFAESEKTPGTSERDGVSETGEQGTTSSSTDDRNTATSPGAAGEAAGKRSNGENSGLAEWAGTVAQKEPPEKEEEVTGKEQHPRVEKLSPVPEAPSPIAFHDRGQKCSNPNEVFDVRAGRCVCHPCHLWTAHRGPTEQHESARSTHTKNEASSVPAAAIQMSRENKDGEDEDDDDEEDEDDDDEDDDGDDADGDHGEEDKEKDGDEEEESEGDGNNGQEASEDGDSAKNERNGRESPKKKGGESPTPGNVLVEGDKKEERPPSEAGNPSGGGEAEVQKTEESGTHSSPKPGPGAADPQPKNPRVGSSDDTDKADQSDQIAKKPDAAAEKVQ